MKNIYAEALTLASRCSKSDTNKKIKRKVAENEKKLTSLAYSKELLKKNALLRHCFTLVKGLLFLLNSRHANIALKILLDTFLENSVYD